MKKCPNCGGEMSDVALGWMCRTCRGFVDMQGSFHEHEEKPFLPPLTNADRIRTMSDEELAAFLESTHSNMAIKLGGEYIVRAKEYIKMWLEQPVKGERYEP